MFMWSKNRSKGAAVLAGFLTASVGIAAAGPAQAASPGRTAVEKSSEEVVTELVPGTNTVVTDAGELSASITLPGSASSSAAVSPNALPEGLFVGSGEPVLTTTMEDAVVSSFATGKGTQTLISIESASAAHEYRFPLSLPVGSNAAVEADGSIAVRSSDGSLIGGFRAPWAYDAEGVAVPTRFSLDGDALVQEVSFDDNTAFPVTADPSDAWGWTVCVSTVVGEIAGNALLASKVAKLVARFGSIQRTFEILFRAWNAASDLNKKMEAVAAAGLGLGAEIVGVNSIKGACFDS